MVKILSFLVFAAAAARADLQGCQDIASLACPQWGSLTLLQKLECLVNEEDQLGSICTTEVLARLFEEPADDGCWTNLKEKCAQGVPTDTTGAVQTLECFSAFLDENAESQGLQCDLDEDVGKRHHHRHHPCPPNPNPPYDPNHPHPHPSPPNPPYDPNHPHPHPSPPNPPYDPNHLHPRPQPPNPPYDPNHPRPRPQPPNPPYDPNHPHPHPPMPPYDPSHHHPHPRPPYDPNNPHPHPPPPYDPNHRRPHPPCDHHHHHRHHGGNEGMDEEDFNQIYSNDESANWAAEQSSGQPCRMPWDTFTDDVPLCRGLRAPRWIKVLFFVFVFLALVGALHYRGFHRASKSKMPQDNEQRLMSDYPTKSVVGVV